MKKLGVLLPHLNISLGASLFPIHMLPMYDFFKVQLDNLPEIGFRYRKLSEIFQAVKDEDDPVALGDKHFEIGKVFLLVFKGPSESLELVHNCSHKVSFRGWNFLRGFDTIQEPRHLHPKVFKSKNVSFWDGGIYGHHTRYMIRSSLSQWQHLSGGVG